MFHIKSSATSAKNIVRVDASAERELVKTCMECPDDIHANEEGTPINNRYNANTLQSIRGRIVRDGLTAADILINIIIIPILNDVRNLRGFISVLPYMTLLILPSIE